MDSLRPHKHSVLGYPHMDLVKKRDLWIFHHSSDLDSIGNPICAQCSVYSFYSRLGKHRLARIYDRPPNVGHFQCIFGGIFCSLLSWYVELRMDDMVMVVEANKKDAPI